MKKLPLIAVNHFRMVDYNFSWFNEPVGYWIDGPLPKDTVLQYYQPSNHNIMVCDYDKNNFNHLDTCIGKEFLSYFHGMRSNQELNDFYLTASEKCGSFKVSFVVEGYIGRYNRWKNHEFLVRKKLARSKKYTPDVYSKEFIQQYKKTVQHNYYSRDKIIDVTKEYFSIDFSDKNGPLMFKLLYL